MSASFRTGQVGRAQYGVPPEKRWTSQPMRPRAPSRKGFRPRLVSLGRISAPRQRWQASLRIHQELASTRQTNPGPRRSARQGSPQGAPLRPVQAQRLAGFVEDGGFGSRSRARPRGRTGAPRFPETSIEQRDQLFPDPAAQEAPVAIRRVSAQPISWRARWASTSARCARTSGRKRSPEQAGNTASPAGGAPRISRSSTVSARSSA